MLSQTSWNHNFIFQSAVHAIVLAVLSNLWVVAAIFNLRVISSKLDSVFETPIVMTVLTPLCFAIFLPSFKTLLCAASWRGFCWSSFITLWHHLSGICLGLALSFLSPFIFLDEFFSSVLSFFVLVLFLLVLFVIPCVFFWKKRGYYALLMLFSLPFSFFAPNLRVCYYSF
eukprot:JP437357.1.p1 GENE.JP437357.1~~JP437357.1.p1  ORF type:complete len:171 (+),score=0.34 JP437357.1:69-581(+)